MAIELIAKIKPAENGTFPMVDAEDVAFQTGRLPDFLFVPLTQSQYNQKKTNGELNPNTPYLIVEDIEA